MTSVGVQRALKRSKVCFCSLMWILTGRKLDVMASMTRALG